LQIDRMIDSVFTIVEVISQIWLFIAVIRRKVGFQQKVEIEVRSELQIVNFGMLHFVLLQTCYLLDLKWRIDQNW